MKIFTQKKLSPIINPITIAIAGWTIFFLLYFVLKNLSWAERHSAYFPLIGETGLDGIAAILTFNLSKKINNTDYKKLFLIFSFSFIASFIADLIYNIVINLFNFKYENTFIILLFDAPFVLFLLLQLTALAYLILLNKKDIKNVKKTFYAPNIILAALMFIMFMFGIPWKIDYFSTIGFFQSIDTILEVSGFALATICLARAKTLLIKSLAIGYLFIVSSDFIIRYYIVSGLIPYLSSFESTWVLGLLIICVGCSMNLNKINEDTCRLLPANSLQPQITIWSLILWLGLSILFIGSNYLFSKNNGYRQINPNLLSIFFPFSVLSIIGSSYLSTKISSKLHRLENIINQSIIDNYINVSNLDDQIEIENNNNIQEGNENFDIYEIEKLTQFIMKSIKELQASAKIKSEFIMNMSHDFRTPASGIYHISRSIYKKINDPELKKMQKLIVDSSEQLMIFLDDVLDYSRFNNDKHELNIKSININEIINEVVLFISAKAKEKMLSITFHHHDLPIIYNSDKLLIHRIMLNIIANAIKFTHIGGITIKTHEEQIENTNWLSIKVTDTGIGIDPSNHKLIFEPFTRVKSPEIAGSSGIGLGLSNVALMLKKIGGKITVESKLNCGSTFNVLLPLFNKE